MSDDSNGKPGHQGWIFSYHAWEPRDEGRREAIFALGNGIFVTRAAATDATADAVHYPGTYHAGLYDRLCDHIAGEQEETESLVNLPNWLPLIFRIDGGDWFHLDGADLLAYAHMLNLKTGVATRKFVFRDERGRHTMVCEHRLVSMAHPHLAALRLEVTPQDWSGEIEFCSALDGDIANTNVARYADYGHRHLVAHRCQTISGDTVGLSARTVQSRIAIAQALRTSLDAQATATQLAQRGDAWIGRTLRAAATPGTTLPLEKVAALYTSCDADTGDAEASACAALEKAECFTGLRAAHERAWSRLWSQVAIDIEREEIARPLRLHAFHILQTVSPHTVGLDVGLPARGWHGEAYRGHIFWDELFVFPFLNSRFPEIARSLLLYRYRRLDAARAAAQANGYRGAMYPWRSASDGREVTPHHQKNLLSGQWMRDDTYLQRHIGSAVAWSVWRYYLTTGDAGFLADCGAEMMLEIARFWASIAQPAPDGDRYEIKGIIGPDEYHNAYPGAAAPGLDNNAYTNVMAVWTLCRALEVLEHVPAQRREELVNQLGLEQGEFALWDRISRRMRVVFHGDGIISQFEGFERLPEFSRDMLPPSLRDKRTDWALRAIGSNADDFQVTKQADVLTLFYLFPEDEVYGLLKRLGYDFDHACTRRTANYYLPRTTHRSSLSRVVYAGALAKVDPDLSWRLYLQALTTDLDVLQGESISEGIHLGAMGGTLDILQRRYLGVVGCTDGLHVDPMLPEELGRVRMAILYRGNALEVEARNGVVQVLSKGSNGGDVELIHAGRRTVLKPGGAVSVASA